MKNKITILFIVFSIYGVAQTAGFLGRKNNISVIADFHPLGYYTGNFVQRKNFFSIGFEYERILSRKLSLCLGYKPISTTLLISDHSYNPTFVAVDYKGGDVFVKLRIYGMKREGAPSPLGCYMSIDLGMPFYNVYVGDEEMEKIRDVFAGVELGVQNVMLGFVTYDYGFKVGFTTTIFESRSAFEIDTQLTGMGVFMNNNMVSVFVKFGFLPSLQFLKKKKMSSN